MPPLTLLSAFAQTSAERLVNSFFEGALLALLVWLALRFIPRQNASTRFSLWMAALLSIATLPMAEALARVDQPMASAVSHAALTVPGGWGIALFVTWAAIALMLLARVAVGIVQLVRLRNSAEEVEVASLDELPRRTLTDFQQHRHTTLCASDRVSVPTALGLFRPAVVLPRWTLSELSAADLNFVLVHELAHLRRRDDWTNLLQKLISAIFFFHPAVWWIENRLSLEREMACDEHVLANTEDPRAYAECLVSLAEKGFLHRAAMLAQGAVHRVRECSTRVARILAGGRPCSPRASRLALLSAASGSVLLLGTLAHAPSLIAFSSPVANGSIAATRPLSSGPTHAQSAGVAVTNADWHPESQMTARMTPATYVASQPTVKQLSKPAANVRRQMPVMRSFAATKSTSAPAVYRARFTLPPANAVPGTFVIVNETRFYSDGSQVWAVAIYRMTVFKPQPQAPSDISRKAI